MKKFIAITGGIGSGKSTVAKCIQQLQFPVFSCDEIYAQLLFDDEYVEKLQQVFPEVINSGSIDKKKLSKIVFSNEKKRKKLEEIAHPIIMRCLFDKMSEAGENLVFAEVPLLFEGNYQNLFDAVIVVVRDKAKRIESIMQRDGLTKEEVLSRMEAQFSYDNLNEKSFAKNPPMYFFENNEDVKKLCDWLLGFMKTMQS